MSDRDLDIKVAELVMGFDRMNARIDPMNRNGEPQYYMGYPHGHDFAPRYSTDIASAFLVAEKMRERGFDISMKHSEWADNKRRWLVEFDAGGAGDGATYRNADGDSLPRAICEAALEL